jgi:hypothetical protein
VRWSSTSPPPTVQCVCCGHFPPPPPPLSEPLSEVNSADPGSSWCGGGGTDWCVGTLSQGIASEGLTPSEPRYRSVLGNWNFRTGPTPLQLFLFSFFQAGSLSAPTLPRSSCLIKNIYIYLFVLPFYSEYILVIYFLFV